MRSCDNGLRMFRRLVISALCAWALLLPPARAAATSWVPRVDNAVVALDARTGERRWQYFPERFSGAEYRLYPGLLLVDGYSDRSLTFVDGGTGSRTLTTPARWFVIGLDPATGALRDGTPPSTEPLARSATFAQPDVRLANGWILNRGQEKRAEFTDQQGHVTWTVDSDGRGYDVAAWGNTVFLARAYFLMEESDAVAVYAYEAGTVAPSWTFAPMPLVRAMRSPTLPEFLHALYFRVIGDDLYVGVQEYVFRIDPESGAVVQAWDLPALTGVRFRGGFFFGGLNVATFSADKDTLVIAFEGRVVALDRLTGALLWHRKPGAFPSDPSPLVHGGLVVLTANEPLAGPRPPAPTPPEPAQSSAGCTRCAMVVQPENRFSSFAVLLGLLAALVRSGRRTSW